MALDTYAGLQTAILSWLARPGDTLVEPAVPDMIRLFEREATRRLKVAGAEKRASLTAVSSAVLLPADFGELRLATSGGVNLTYVPPHQLLGGGGSPAHYTIIGNELHLGPGPDQTCTIEIIYQSGVPPLSDSNPTNWLLDQHPDCYLFGALTEAESYIGHDERVPLWAQRREATFASIEQHDRKQRWNGTPLSIRAQGINYSGGGSAAGDWISAPPVAIPITAIVAGPGLVGGGTSGPVALALDSPVTISNGGTDASTASQALINLGAAPLASPTFTGDPQAPTPPPGDNDTSIATTAFVQAAMTVAGGIPDAPNDISYYGRHAASWEAVAPILSPVLAGAPQSPTPTFGANNNLIATAAFVQAAVSANAGITQLTGAVTAGPGAGSQVATIADDAVATAKIANSAVTYAKMQNVAASRLLGNPTGSAAAPAEITLGTGLSFAGNVLNASGGAGGGDIDGVIAGAGLAGGGTSGTVTLTTSVPSVTKTTNYTVTAADLGGTLVCTGATGIITLPAGIFTPGSRLTIMVTGSSGWSVTNSTGLTMTGLNTTIQGGTSGTFIANADGTSINFIPGLQAPINANTLGGVRQLTATANNFVTGLSTGGILSTAQPSFSNISGTLGIAAGGTNATTAAAALTSLGAVPLAGGTMTGALGITAAGPTPFIITTPTGADAQINLHNGTTADWLLCSRGSSSPGEFWIYNNKTGQLPFSITQANDTLFSGGVLVGAPTGGLKGAGTINATGVYANNTLLTSDATVKTDIEPLAVGCLPLVASVAPKSFRWREPDDPATVPEGWSEHRHSGFLAQDLVEAEVPGIVEGKPGEGMALDVGAMLAVLWQAVRELATEVAALKAAQA